MATINFSLAGVQLLIEGGFYLFWRVCADLMVSCCDRLVFQDYFSNSRDITIEKQQQNQAGMSSIMLLPLTDNRSWRANMVTPT